MLLPTQEGIPRRQMQHLAGSLRLLDYGPP
ncbi:hypothetical protein ACVW0B_002775 [Thermostichus sp. MS-CIW-23]